MNLIESQCAFTLIKCKFIFFFKNQGLEYLHSLLFFHDIVYYSSLYSLQFIQSMPSTFKLRQAVSLVSSIANEISFFLNSYHCSYWECQILMSRAKNNQFVFTNVLFCPVIFAKYGFSWVFPFSLGTCDAK